MGPKKIDVHRRSAAHARPGARYGVGKKGRLGDALPRASVGFGHGNAEPSALGHGLHEGFRELPFLIALTPVG